MKKLNLKFNKKKKLNFKVRNSNSTNKRRVSVGVKLVIVLGLAIIVLLFGMVRQRMDFVDEAKMNDYDPGASYYATSLQRGSLLLQSLSSVWSEGKQTLVKMAVNSGRLITGASVTESSELNVAGVTGDMSLTVMEAFLTTTCGVLNSTNGVYTLQNNVNANETCFTILANNITLDGNGMTITYGINESPDQYGIYVNSSNYTIVQNAIIIQGNATGVNKYALYYANATNGTIQNNNITTNGFTVYGIYTVSSSNLTIASNVVETHESLGHGIYSVSSSNVTVISNTINTNASSAYGIAFTRSNNSGIVSNTINTSGDSAYGIYWEDNSDYNTLSTNIITTNGSTAYGISLDTCLRPILLSNNITTRGVDAYGMNIGGCTNSNVTTNTVMTSNTRGQGIYLTVSTNSLLVSNNITTQGVDAYGITFNGNANSNATANSIVTSNTNANGIRLYSSANSNFFTSNRINVSKAERIFLTSSSQNNVFTNNSILLRNYSYTDVKFATALNGTVFIDQYLENYNFTGTGGKIKVKNSQFGEIVFLNVVNGSGLNFSNDVRVANDLVFVNSTQTGLNVSANITVYNLATNFLRPVMLRDGVACPTTICTNLTSLNAGNVLFNVTGWSNYSVNNDPTVLTACGSLTSANTGYTLLNNVVSSGTCFTIEAANVTLDCAGYTITFGNATGASYGVYVNQTNVTVKNGIITRTNGSFIQGEGIYYTNAVNGLIFNNTVLIYGNLSDGVLMAGTSHGVNISSNLITTLGNSSPAMKLQDSVYNISVHNNIMNTTGTSAYGIHLNPGNNSQFMNNVVVTWNDQSSGLAFDSGTGCNFTNNSISTYYGANTAPILLNGNNNQFQENTFSTYGDSAAVGLQNSNNVFNHNRINVFNQSASGRAGIVFVSGSNNSFTNDILNISALSFAATVMAGDGLFSNVTFDKTNISFTGGAGNVTVQWYVITTVVNNTGGVLSGAEVNGTTAQTVREDSKTTGASGIATLTLTDFTRNATQITYKTPHNITTTLTNYTMNTTQVNVTLMNSTSLTITLTSNADITAPYFMQALTNQTVELGTAFSYDINATDGVLFANYSINDTTNFAINSIPVFL
ncbi:right-handed parallel beta-helix repeat-containing protein [Candidatus Woesearchaeota archaeon]|nr:right-handed parallel beta-helix repeat-containing protein [Candidatus Woesearchaeota archaeon]